MGKQENLTEEWGIDKAIQSEEFWVQVAKKVLKSAQTKCGSVGASVYRDVLQVLSHQQNETWNKFRSETM